MKREKPLVGLFRVLTDGWSSGSISLLTSWGGLIIEDDEGGLEGVEEDEKEMGCED